MMFQSSGLRNVQNVFLIHVYHNVLSDLLTLLHIKTSKNQLQSTFKNLTDIFLKTWSNI